MDRNIGGNVEAFSYGATFRFESQAAGYGGTTYKNASITFRSTSTIPYQNMYHEFGHLMEFRSGEFFTDRLNDQKVYDEFGNFVMGGPANDYQ